MTQTTIRPTIALFFFALSVSPLADAAPSDGVETVLRGFSQAGDHRNLAAVDKHTHPEFRVVFSVHGKPGVQIVDRATYKKLLADKKIGGGERTMRILDISVKDGIAVAKVHQERKDATFEAVSTLVKDQGQWKILEEAVVLTPKGT